MERTILIDTICNSHVINSCDPVDKLKRNHGDHKLISSDAKSLFTKVPITDLLVFLREKLDDIDLPFSSDTCIELIKLCIVDNYFTVDGKYFKQIFGMAMGNPLSPVLSNLYMEFFETRILPNICRFPLFWIRYVDDILVLWPLNEDPLVFLELLTI